MVLLKKLYIPNLDIKYFQVVKMFIIKNRSQVVF